MVAKARKYQIFFFIFVIALTAITFTLFSHGMIYTVVLSISVGIVLYVTKGIWLPEDQGKYAVRLVSLAIALSAILAFGFWQRLFENVVKAAIAKYLPGFAANYYVESPPPYLIFLFLATIILIVSYFNRDKTAMGVHPAPIDKDIPSRTFYEKLTGVCEALNADLRDIDIKTSWSAHFFTPLDAEVEVSTPTGKKRMITDLLTAIRSSKDRLFLVLGDPGSGKSVALRKLCQDLSKEIQKTGKIPIYVNLKEWKVDQKWDERNLPSNEDLYNFVLSNVKKRDIGISRFFGTKIDEETTYFDRLYETGRLYFVLDSFDEIPAVLNEKENSIVIKLLSKIIFMFLKGARSEQSQGILASRFFRRPTQEFQATTTLEILPFTEKKIIQTLRRSGQYDEELLVNLFKEGIELVPVARNPFSATLMAEFAEHNHNELPANQSEMYASYIERTLDSCIDQIEKRNLTKEQVKTFAIDIADQMFGSNYGFEAPVHELRRCFEGSPVDNIIDILKFARLGRGATGDANRFSFVHRRFAEYFSVQKLLENPESIDLQSIPIDSQLRDALVLFCEVADHQQAAGIANFCWKIIITSNNPQDLSVIHSMRFLRDAFKGRLECIQTFRKGLAKYIYEQIHEKNNMISVKLAVETVGLLEDSDMDKCIVRAMKLNNPWINQAAFKSCRHLPKISLELRKALVKYISKFSLTTLISEKEELNLSLSLSEAFSDFKKMINIRAFAKYYTLFGILASTKGSNSFLERRLIFYLPMILFVYPPLIYYLN